MEREKEVYFVLKGGLSEMRGNKKERSLKLIIKFFLFFPVILEHIISGFGKFFTVNNQEFLML